MHLCPAQADGASGLTAFPDGLQRISLEAGLDGLNTGAEVGRHLFHGAAQFGHPAKLDRIENDFDGLHRLLLPGEKTKNPPTRLARAGF